MVEGVENPQRIGDLKRGTPEHMREHLIAIRNIADEARFGSADQKATALENIVLGCRCALK